MKADRPVGEGKYGIVKHQNHAELAYTLEIPNDPGEAQKELGIEKEASLIQKFLLLQVTQALKNHQNIQKKY